MHEFAIGERIVDAVLEELARLESPVRLLRVHVVAGGLHQLVPDYLDTAYEVLTRETAAEGSKMELEVRPVRGRCRSCGWVGTIRAPWFRCGACGEPGIEMVAGKELYLDRLEVEETGRPSAPV